MFILETCVSVWSGLGSYRGKKLRPTLKALQPHNPSPIATSLESPGLEKPALVGSGPPKAHCVSVTKPRLPVLLRAVRVLSEA